MKKAFAIFFLLAFVIQSTSSLWIITSFYIQRDYISKNICVNRFDAISVCKGQCFLTEQIKENQNKEQSIPLTKLQEVQLFFHHNEANSLPELSYFELLMTSTLKEKSFASDFVFSIFHPPCV